MFSLVTAWRLEEGDLALSRPNGPLRGHGSRSPAGTRGPTVQFGPGLVPYDNGRATDQLLLVLAGAGS
jgi:hypothetical protein